MIVCIVVFQAEDGIRCRVRSRGLGDVYKRQVRKGHRGIADLGREHLHQHGGDRSVDQGDVEDQDCLLYTSDAADERSSVDLGGRRIIKKKKTCRSQDMGSKKQ